MKNHKVDVISVKESDVIKKQKKVIMILLFVILFFIGLTVIMYLQLDEKDMVISMLRKAISNK